MLWTLWPAWVWFAVMATGNHFWLDIAAGVGVALVAGDDRLGPSEPAVAAARSTAPRLPALVASRERVTCTQPSVARAHDQDAPAVASRSGWPGSRARA